MPPLPIATEFIYYMEGRSREPRGMNIEFAFVNMFSARAGR